MSWCNSPTSDDGCIWLGPPNTLPLIITYNPNLILVMTKTQVMQRTCYKKIVKMINELFPFLTAIGFVYDMEQTGKHLHVFPYYTITPPPLGITHSVVIQWLRYQNEKVHADRNDRGTTTERVGKCTV